MEKHLHPVAVFTATALSLSALAQSTAEHTPRDFDRLSPGISSYHGAIQSVNHGERLVTYNPGAFYTGDTSEASIHIDSDTVSYVQFATKHRFLLRGDTLSYIGFENRATDFRLDSPVAMAVFPLTEGNRNESGWSGHVMNRGGMMLKRMTGTSTGHVEGGWTLTDGADTIRNATRLIWSLDMAYADADSVDVSLPDSVASDRISDMRVDVAGVLSERLLMERELWFSPAARYPVLQESRVARVIMDADRQVPDTIPQSFLAMHYPPAFQQGDTGEEIVLKPSSGMDGRGNGYGTGYAGAGTSVAVGEPEIMGNEVGVVLSAQAGDTEATLTLYSDSGIRLTDPVAVTLGRIPQQYSLGIPSGWKGVILLRVDAGDESHTRKIIL